MRAKPAEGKAWTEVKEDAEMKYGIVYHVSVTPFMNCTAFDTDSWGGIDISMCT